MGCKDQLFLGISFYIFYCNYAFKYDKLVGIITLSNQNLKEPPMYKKLFLCLITLTGFNIIYGQTTIADVFMKGSQTSPAQEAIEKVLNAQTNLENAYKSGNMPQIQKYEEILKTIKEAFSKIDFDKLAQELKTVDRAEIMNEFWNQRVKVANNEVTLATTRLEAVKKLYGSHSSQVSEAQQALKKALDDQREIILSAAQID